MTLRERFAAWLRKSRRRSAKATLRFMAREERRQGLGTFWQGEYRGWFTLTLAERDEVAQGRKTVSGTRARSRIHSVSPVVK